MSSSAGHLINSLKLWSNSFFCKSWKMFFIPYDRTVAWDVYFECFIPSKTTQYIFYCSWKFVTVFFRISHGSFSVIKRCRQEYFLHYLLIRWRIETWPIPDQNQKASNSNIASLPYYCPFLKCRHFYFRINLQFSLIFINPSMNEWKVVSWFVGW